MKMKGTYHLDISKRLEEAFCLSDIVLSKDFLLQKQVESLVEKHDFQGAIIHNLDDLEMIQVDQHLIHQNGSVELNPFSEEGILIVLPFHAHTTIQRAMLLADYTGNLSFFVSNDEGKTYIPIAPGETKDFTSSGQVLSVKTVFRKGTLSSALHEIAILF